MVTGTDELDRKYIKELEKERDDVQHLLDVALTNLDDAKKFIGSIKASCEYAKVSEMNTPAKMMDTIVEDIQEFMTGYADYWGTDQDIVAEKARHKEFEYKEALRQKRLCPRCEQWKSRGMGDFCPDHDQDAMSEEEKEFQ
jgi:hypothetical protein